MREKEPPDLAHHARFTGPSLVRKIPLADIDATDTSFQYRTSVAPKSLLESLARNGQIDPIKVMPGTKKFLILDGFSRVQATRTLGQDRILAAVYPPMPIDDARRIAFVSNVVRRNLTVIEKANAMRLARAEGFAIDDVAELFGISSRHVARYLALPESVLVHIDGRRVTMAHGAVLATLGPDPEPEVIQRLVARIQREHLSAKDVRRLLPRRRRAKGREKRRRQQPRQLGRLARNRVRIFPIDVRRTARPEDVSHAISFLRDAIRAIEGFGVVSRSDP